MNPPFPDLPFPDLPFPDGAIQNVPVTFAAPMLLWGLLLLPLAALGYLVAQRRRARFAVRFTNLDLLASVVQRSPGWRRHLPPLLYLAALGLLLVGLAQPRATLSVPREEATVVLVMDVSGSMAATDVEPDRLSAAQTAVGDFVDGLPERFRIGLVAFSASAQPLVQPTTDRAAVRAAIARLRAEGGTAMGDGIARGVEIVATDALIASDGGGAVGGGAAGAAGSVEPPGASDRGLGADAPVASPTAAVVTTEPPPAAVLLLSDGANTSGTTDPLDAAAQAREAGVPVFTIAFGTPDGVLEQGAGGGGVGVGGGSSGSTGSTGSTGSGLGAGGGAGSGGSGGGSSLQRVPVPPDEATLRRIAETTGARFFAAPSAEELQAVYADLGSRIGFAEEEREITVAFAAAALLPLLVAGALSLRWFNRFP